jgi:tetrahydromethanopterin S-methyltransferase subunit G
MRYKKGETCTACKNKNMNHTEGVLFGVFIGVILGASLVLLIVSAR